MIDISTRLVIEIICLIGVIGGIFLYVLRNEKQDYWKGVTAMLTAMTLLMFVIAMNVLTLAFPRTFNWFNTFC